MKLISTTFFLMMSLCTSAAWSQNAAELNQITTFYQQYLNRTPTPFEIGLHTTSMQLFGEDLVDVQATILGSTEMYQLAGNDHEGYIRKLFQVLRLPAPSQREVNRWHDELDRLRGDRIGFAKTFVQETAGQRNQPVDRPTLVEMKQAVRDYLKREPNLPEGRALLAAIQQGFAENQIRASILGSPEYFRLSGQDNQTFIERLHSDHRLPRPNRLEVRKWLTKLQQPGQDRSTIALEFLDANVQNQRPTNRPTINANQLVEQWYQSYLARRPSDFEMTGIQFALQQGQSLDDVRATLLGGQEYYRRKGTTDLEWINGIYNDLNLAPLTFQQRSQLMTRFYSVFNSDRIKLVNEIVRINNVPLVPDRRRPPTRRPRTRPEQLAQIDRWFRLYLNRPMSGFEKTGITGVLDSGTSADEIQVSILSGVEFFQKNGNNNTGFIRGLHKAVTGTEVSPAELRRLDRDLTRRGQTRTGFVQAFLRDEGNDDHDHDHDHHPPGLAKNCIEDSFNDRNFTQVRDHKMDRGNGWIAEAGLPIIRNNRAELTGKNVRMITTGKSSNGTITCTLRFEAGTGTQIAIIPFRYHNLDNHWRLQIRKDTGTVEVKQRFVGTDTTLASRNVQLRNDVDYQIKIHLEGNKVEIESPWKIGPLTDTRLQTAAGVGCWIFSDDDRFRVSFDSLKFCENGRRGRGGVPRFP